MGISNISSDKSFKQCVDCSFIHYSPADSALRNKVGPLIYVLFSPCVARALFEKDPTLYNFKLGFSKGNQDRLKSVTEGFKRRGIRSLPLANCKKWEVIGAWQMKYAEKFERRFIRWARENSRIVPRGAYLDDVSVLIDGHTNG